MGWSFHNSINEPITCYNWLTTKGRPFFKFFGHLFDPEIVERIHETCWILVYISRDLCTEIHIYTASQPCANRNHSAHGIISPQQVFMLEEVSCYCITYPNDTLTMPLDAQGGKHLVFSAPGLSPWQPGTFLSLWGSRGFLNGICDYSTEIERILMPW